MFHARLRLLPSLGGVFSLAFALLALVLPMACGGQSHAPLATISSFKAAPAIITPGQGTVLTFTFSGGTASLDHGIGAVTSGQAINVTPASDTTYTLTAINADGTATTSSVTISVKSFTGRFVYVANSGGGITGFALNDATGVLQELGNSPWDETVMALQVTSDLSGKFVFAVNGDGETLLNTVTVYRVNAANGDLTRVGAYATGLDPWDAAVDPTGSYLYVRCDGAISGYAINATTGALTPLAPATVATSTGIGGLTIHPSGQYLFTVGRTSNSLQVFNLNPLSGALTANGSAYSLPAGTGPMEVALGNTGEFLFTKSEGPSGATSQACVVYGYRLNVGTGALTALAPFDTGLFSSDVFHGVFANPARPVLYLPLYNSDNDYTALAFNAAAGTFTPIPATTYTLFGGSGCDHLVVSRSGKWGFLVDYDGGKVAVGAVDTATGAIGTPSFYGVGNFPVSITVVGTVQ